MGGGRLVIRKMKGTGLAQILLPSVHCRLFLAEAIHSMGWALKLSLLPFAQG